jgi:hypothetical protein
MYEKSRERKRNKEKMRQIDNEGKENSIPNTHVEEKWVERLKTFMKKPLKIMHEEIRAAAPMRQKK